MASIHLFPFLLPSRYLSLIPSFPFLSLPCHKGAPLKRARGSIGSAAVKARVQPQPKLNMVHFKWTNNASGKYNYGELR